LGDSRDNSPTIFHRPHHAAILVRPAKRAEVEHRTVSPQSCVPVLVTRQAGETRYQTLIVDAIASAICSSEVIEIGYLILL
jgi:hypothetical protein